MLLVCALRKKKKKSFYKKLLSFNGAKEFIWGLDLQLIISVDRLGCCVMILIKLYKSIELDKPK